MSHEALANAAYIAGLLALAGFLIWACRDDKPTEEERVAAARRRVGLMPLMAREEWVYEGPDSLQLLEDLEAHMKAYGARVADLYDTTPGDTR